MLLGLSMFLALLFVISSSSFWVMWLGMEMYNFFFTPWLMEEESYKKSSKIFFYFVIQVVASGMFLLGLSNSSNIFFFIIMMISILIKLGSFPFHSWVLVVIENMNWMKFSAFMTITKLSSLVALLFLHPILSFVKLVWGGMFLPIFGLKNSSIRMILTYSSIAYMSWIVTTVCLSKSLFFFFISFYWIIFFSACAFFKAYSINSVKDFFQGSFSFLDMSLIYSLMGFPPFLGFFPKLYTLKLLCDSTLIWEAVILGVMSVIPFYFYLKLIMSCTLKYQFKNQSFLPIMPKKSMFFNLLLFLFSLEFFLFFVM